MFRLLPKWLHYLWGTNPEEKDTFVRPEHREKRFSGLTAAWVSFISGPFLIILLGLASTTFYHNLGQQRNQCLGHRSPEVWLFGSLLSVYLGPCLPFWEGNGVLREWISSKTHTHRKKGKRKPSSQRNLESFQRLRKKRDLKCSRVSFKMHIWIMQEQSCHDKGYCTVALHFLCIEWVSLRCRRNSMDYEHHEWWGSSCTGYTILPAL